MGDEGLEPVPSFPQKTSLLEQGNAESDAFSGDDERLRGLGIKHVLSLTLKDDPDLGEVGRCFHIMVQLAMSGAPVVVGTGIAGLYSNRLSGPVGI